MTKSFVPFALGAALFAAAPAFAADAPAALNQCKACHKFETGKNAVGPSLFGVVGRKAGTAPAFNYSPAMAAAGFDWTEEKLSAYIADPKAVVPGNKMTFPGLKKPEDVKAVVDYLVTLK